MKAAKFGYSSNRKSPTVTSSMGCSITDLIPCCLSLNTALSSANTTPSMEIAGLVFGSVTLPSLLNTCFDTYNRIEGLKEAAGDLADVRSRLDLEVRKLRYIENKSDSGTLDKDAEEVMILAQQQVNDRLMKIQSIVFKYCHEEPGTSSLLRPKEQRFSRSPGSRLKWITSDKDNLEEQLLRMQHLTETLWKLATSEPESVREDYISRTDTIATRDASFLTTVAAMSAQQYPGLVKAARVKQRLSQCMGVTSVRLSASGSGSQRRLTISRPCQLPTPREASPSSISR